MSIQLAFRALGAGRPVVILHGLFGAGCNWTPIAQSLATHYRVYLPDARNHGASPWSESMTYPEMALDVKALIESEHLEQPFVVGHSMGGKTAMALALENPQLISGLAVIDIAPERYAEQFPSYVSAMRSLSVAAAATQRQIQDLLASSLHPGASEEFLQQNLRRYNDRFDWRVNLMATVRCMRDLCTFPEPLQHQRYDGLALFLAGADSDYVRPESMETILNLFPAVQVERIPDAGHWVHVDQPQALLCGLHDWLSEASAALASH